MSSIKKVVGNTLLYSLSSLILRASSIIFFPIFSLYLTKADYGILSVTQSIVAIITSISSLQILTAITRFIYDKSLVSENIVSAEIKNKEILATGISIVVISNFLWVSLLIIFGNIILAPILNDIPFFPYMFYSILALLFTSIVDVYKGYLKATHKGKMSFWFEIAYFGANIGLNLFFVVFFRMNVIGLILSTFICGIFFSLYVFYAEFKGFRFYYNKIFAKKFLIYSLPLIPFSLLGFLLSNIDSFMLNSIRGVEASGLYYISLTFAGIFATIKESILSAITPWFFEFYETKKELIKKLVIHVFMAGAILSIGISLFSLEVLKVLSNNPDLIDGWRYIPLINIGYLIVFIAQLINLPVYYQKNKTSFLILANFGGFIATFIVAFLFIDKLGIYGAVISKTVGYTVMTIIIVQISKNVMDFKINFIQVLLILFATILLSFLNYLPIHYLYLISLKISIFLLLILFFLRTILRNYFGVKRNFVLLKQNLFKNRKN